MGDAPAPQNARVQAILWELERVTTEYKETKGEFDAANVRLEAARERFAAVRRIATELLSEADWGDWRRQHVEVRYVGLTIGQAIINALRYTAYFSAFEIEKNTDKPYRPEMTIEQIQETLEVGGFEFRGPTPRREINAALLKLEGAEKAGESDYRASDAYAILESIVGAETARKATGQDSDDDVPF